MSATRKRKSMAEDSHSQRSAKPRDQGPSRPPQPPRRSLLFLIASIALFMVWLAYLMYVALFL